ncbi:MAG: hypothetical protein J6Q79_09500 [Clostridia bacterium]|nr:hypothetical protein [Clostridia bacterium]
MIYEIRLKARQKQAQCSAILFLSFMITALVVLTVNLFPLVYISTVKTLSGDNKILSLIVSTFLLHICITLYSALSLGVDRFMLKRSENISAGAGDIFYYFRFRNLISMLKFYIAFSVRRLLFYIVLLLPFAICLGTFISLCNKGFSAAVCLVFGVFSVLFMLLAVITFHRISDTYFLSKYKFIKGDYLNLKQLFAISQEAMLPKIKRLRQMKLSFSGWFLLCILIVPIPYVWSYYRQCKACFAAECM